MVASPEGAWVYSVGLGSSRLVLLDPVFSRLFSELIPRPTGLQKGNPLGTGVGVTGDGTRVWVYVSQFDGGWLTAVDPAKVRPGADGAGVVDQFNVGGQIKGMVVSPDGSRLHLARSTPSQGEVVTYDSVTHQPAVITALDSRPGWPTVMALSPDGRTVYLPTGDDSDRLTVIDTASGGVRCTIPLGAGVRAGPVQVSPDGRWVYVGCAGSRPFLGVIDVPTSELVASIPIALDPSAIAIPADGTRIYVRSSTGTLSVVTMVE
jgi:DNA-binding beta-propeller fold protein YncE